MKHYSYIKKSPFHLFCYVIEALGNIKKWLDKTYKVQKKTYNMLK